MTTKLVIGCGYLGRRVARRWRAAGARVVALTRSEEHARQLADEGLEPRVADVTQARTLHDLPAAATILYAVGYDPRAGQTRRAVQLEGLQTTLDALPAPIGLLVYVSSSGVYGDAAGGWVDEESACRPTRESARLALAAEELLRGHPQAARAVILRLAGLYGPGRIPNLGLLAAGKPLAVPPRGMLNLIHVDDAASAILAAEARARPGRTYLVGDGHPVGRQEFYRHVARLLGRDPPVFIEPLPDSPAAIRSQDDKRLSNARLLEELQVTLRYPTCVEGLTAIVGGS